MIAGWPHTSLVSLTWKQRGLLRDAIALVTDCSCVPATTAAGNPIHREGKRVGVKLPVVRRDVCRVFDITEIFSFSIQAARKVTISSRTSL